jgi:hypothetical protein
VLEHPLQQDISAVKRMIKQNLGIGLADYPDIGNN